VDETTETGPLADIFNLLDLRFCAQASISFSKSSMRETRVLLSKTSGPAVGGCWDEGTGRNSDRPTNR